MPFPNDNNSNLIPRPLPKPTLIDVTSVKPVVPDVSLVFDSSIPNDQSQQISSCHYQKPSNFCSRMHYIPNNGPEKTKPSIPFDSSHCSLTPTHTPQCSKKLPELCSKSKKVSFSPQSCKYNPKSMSPSQHYGTTENVKTNTTPEPFNCCDLCSDSSNSPKYSAQPYVRHTHKIQHSDLDFSVSNRCSFPKQDSYTNYPQDFHGMNYNHKSQEQKANVSSEEFEQTVLKFENIFLKLNYKYNEISEQFVSKEELNTMMKKYENTIEILLQRINELTSKLNRENCEHFRKRNESITDLTPKMNQAKCSRVNEMQKHEEKVPSEDFAERNSPRVIDYVSPVKNKFFSADYESNNHCPKFRETSEETNKFREYRFSREQYENSTSVNESKPNYYNQYRERRHLNDEAVEHFSANQSNQMNLNEFYTKDKNGIMNRCEEIIESTEQPKLTAKSLEEKKQFQKMYSNIVNNVKIMVEKNLAEKDKIDPINLIKKATLEQFRKMGISVDDIENEERYQSNENQNDNPNFMNNKSVASSDLSLHMHTLAMKYISNGQQSDEKEQTDRRGSYVDTSVRNNCNNRSIATLEYMERYHLLSAPNQYSNKSAGICTKLNLPIQRYNSYEPPENNDRSFLQ